MSDQEISIGRGICLANIRNEVMWEYISQYVILQAFLFIYGMVLFVESYGIF